MRMHAHAAVFQSLSCPPSWKSSGTVTAVHPAGVRQRQGREDSGRHPHLCGRPERGRVGLPEAFRAGLVRAAHHGQRGPPGRLQRDGAALGLAALRLAGAEPCSPHSYRPTTLKEEGILGAMCCACIYEAVDLLVQSTACNIPQKLLFLSMHASPLHNMYDLSMPGVFPRYEEMLTSWMGPLPRAGAQGGRLPVVGAAPEPLLPAARRSAHRPLPRLCRRASCWRLRMQQLPPTHAAHPMPPSVCSVVHGDWPL